MNWWLVGSVAALILIARRAKAVSTQCKPCYDAKSISYQACMKLIPAEQRAERNACFNAADTALRQCLKTCGG